MTLTDMIRQYVVTTPRERELVAVAKAAEQKIGDWRSAVPKGITAERNHFIEYKDRFDSPEKKAVLHYHDRLAVEYDTRLLAEAQETKSDVDRRSIDFNAVANNVLLYIISLPDRITIGNFTVYGSEEIPKWARDKMRKPYYYKNANRAPTRAASDH